MATFDAHATLARATVATAPSPALSGTSLTVASGEASVFPATPFNCTVYPSDQVPTLSNAEVVRVTNITGDTLTIIRAQEGTAAKVISVGYYIANTVTVKAFTDIENAINANIQSISAGAGVATSNQIVFSNANGVSFGAAGGSVITASVATAGGGGAAISAGANSQSTGTVQFSNSNGVTFGLSNNGVLTASHNGITSQSNQAFSAPGGSSSFQTLVFANSNGVSFSNSNGSVVASVAAGAAPGSISAGTESVALGQVVFSNSNGVSFGLNGSTITAAHNGLTSQSNQAASASNGSFAFQTLGFSNANNVTFGTSAGSIITASVNAAAGGSVNFSAGASSENLASVVFSNSNGVSFGLSNGTITASVSNAGGATLKSWAGYEFNNAAGRQISNNSSVFFVGAFALPVAVSFDYVRFMAIMSNGQSTNSTLNSASASASNQILQSHSALIYSRGTGASSNSLQFFASGSAGWTYENRISITNSSQASYTVGISYPVAGATSSTETQFQQSASTYNFQTSAIGSLFSQTRMIDVPLATVLPPGNYWIFSANQTSSNSAGAAALSAMTNNNIFVNSAYYAQQLNAGPRIMGDTVSNVALLGGGVFTNAGSTASLNITDVKSIASNIAPYFQLLCTN